MHRLLVPNPERIHYLPAAMDAGMSLDEIHEATSIDHWFLREIDALRGLRDCIAGRPLHAIDADLMREAKRAGMTDAYLARILSPAVSELDVRAPQGSGDLRRLLTRRYLRRRVPDLYRLPVPQLCVVVRGRAERAPQGDGVGQRAQPHRPGHRVRLLLYPRLLCLSGDELRDHHG